MTFKAHRLSSDGPAGKPVESLTIAADSDEEAFDRIVRVWPFATFVIERVEEKT